MQDTATMDEVWVKSEGSLGAVCKGKRGLRQEEESKDNPLRKVQPLVDHVKKNVSSFTSHNKRFQ